MAFATIRLAVVLANPKSNIDPFQTANCGNRTLKIIWPGKIWCLSRLITFSYSILRRVFSDFSQSVLSKSEITIPMNFSSFAVCSMQYKQNATGCPHWKFIHGGFPIRWWIQICNQICSLTTTGIQAWNWKIKNSACINVGNHILLSM